MKQIVQFAFCILFPLCFYSCGNQPYPSALLLADSLTNVLPDSAILFLKDMKEEIDTEPKASQIYYQLLCLKANDKAYIRHTSDSLILSIVDYYEHKKKKAHLPEAYYYAGRVYRDLEDAPQALDYFQKAIAASQGSTNYRLISRIYSQMGTLFSYQKMQQEALDMFQKSYQYDELAKDSLGMTFSLRDIARTYRKDNLIDSSLCYYKRSYELANILKHTTLMSMIQNQMASLYIQLKEYDLAQNALQPSLSNLHEPSKSSVYSIASELYHQTGKVDSAIYYYEKLLKCGTIYAKQAAHQRLAEIAIQENKLPATSEHLKQFILCTDSIQKLTQTETIHRMKSLYNYQLREKENLRLKEENEKKKTYIIGIVLTTLLLIILSLTYSQYYRHKSLQLEIQLDKLKTLKKEHYQRSNLFIEENKEKIKELEEKLISADQTHNALKKQLQRQKEIILCTNKQIEMELSEREQAEMALLESKVYMHFKQEALSNNKIQITNADWQALKDAINDTYKEFTANLYKLYNLSEYELHICLLIKINIQPTEMAKLTNHTKESITATRRRLYEKIFHQKGTPKLWDEFIHTL